MSAETPGHRPFEFHLNFLKSHLTIPGTDELSLGRWLKECRDAWRTAYEVAAHGAVINLQERLKERPLAPPPGPRIHEPAPPAFEGGEGPEIQHWTSGRLVEEMAKNMVMGMISALLSTIFKAVHGLFAQRIWPTTA